jgi:hypothetical protein
MKVSIRLSARVEGFDKPTQPIRAQGEWMISC